MPRGLSTAAKNYIGPIAWLVDVTTLAGVKHYFGTLPVKAGGNTYLEYLVYRGARLVRSVQPDSAEIELVNSDLYIGGLLASQVFEGALCELRQYQLGIDNLIYVLRGRMTEQEQSDDAVVFRLISDFDPAQIALHDRNFTHACAWRFARFRSTGVFQTPCGYNPPTRYADALASSPRTANIFTIDNPWTTTPDGTSKFSVVKNFSGGAIPEGMPKIIKRTTSNAFSVEATAITARTVTFADGNMTTDEHKGEILHLDQNPQLYRKIKSNTASVFTIDDSEPDITDFTLRPTHVLYAACPKDFNQSCEQRFRTQSFNGFPTLVPLLRSDIAGSIAPAGGAPGVVGGSGGGTIGGDGGSGGGTIGGGASSGGGIGSTLGPTPKVPL